nr:hypothetical protein [Amycolatopsis methanolica]
MARQPIVLASQEVSGSPKRNASEFPAKTTAVARLARSGPSSRAAIGATTDQNTPCPAAATTRASTATAYPGATASSRFDTAIAPTVTSTAVRRSQRAVSATSGTTDTATTTA